MVSVVPNPGTRVSTPGAFLTVLIFSSYTSLRLKEKSGPFVKVWLSFPYRPKYCLTVMPVKSNCLKKTFLTAHTMETLFSEHL